MSHCLKFEGESNSLGKMGRMSRVFMSGVQTIPAPGTGPGSATRSNEMTFVIIYM